MAKLQSNKKLQNGRRSSKTDEEDKKEAIIEAIASLVDTLEKEFEAEIMYNVDEIILKS